VALYKEVLRKAKENDLSLSSDLLLVPEHTWGLCVQKYYPKTDGWHLEEFEKTKDDPDRLFIEKSWLEQRNYVMNSAKEMGVELSPILNVEEPSVASSAIVAHTPPVSLVWQLFSNQDYRRYEKQYIQITDIWAYWDFTKKGLYDYDSMTLEATVELSYQYQNGFATKVIFPEAETKEYGLPYFWVIEQNDSIEIRMIGKKPSRLPQAIFLKLNHLEGKVWVSKLGEWIDLSNCSPQPLIVGFDGGIKNEKIEICSLDCALVAPFGKHLLEYGRTDLKFDPWFNLYNNIWNTNFPMWFGDDVAFRFKLKSSKLDLIDS
jgi:hypothetical protein